MLDDPECSDCLNKKAYSPECYAKGNDWTFEYKIIARYGTYLNTTSFIQAFNTYIDEEDDAHNWMIPTCNN